MLTVDAQAPVGPYTPDRPRPAACHALAPYDNPARVMGRTPTAWLGCQA